MATTLTLEQCNVKDGPALAYNNMSAFWQDPIWRLSWQHTTLENHILETGKRISRNLLNNRPLLRHQKAVDANGKIVGYARWLLPESMAIVDHVPCWAEAMVPAVSAEEEAEIREIAENANWKADTSHDDKEFEELMSSTKKRRLAAKPYLYLDYLAVHPDNQGKGIAKALVKSGLIQAKKLGLDVFLLAFPAGLGLYNRVGFRVVEQISTIYQIGDTDPVEHTICFMEYEVGNGV